MKRKDGVICGAKTRAGTPCEMLPARGRTRCRLHGGASPRGFAHPLTKTGRHSVDIPTQLAARYHEALADPDLLGMRDEVALLDARLGELLAKIDTGEASTIWGKLREARAEMQAAQDDTARAAAALQSLLRLIDKGAAEWVIWRDIAGVIEARRKVTESERKRLMEMHQTMTTEQAMLLLAVVVDTIRKHVTDRNVLGGISRDLSALLDNGARGAA